MSAEKLYGGKCHICACLRHDREHAVEPIPWLSKPQHVLMWCADCPSCQEASLHEAIMESGLGLFDPEVRKAVHAFQRGDEHPIIDNLRTECQALEASVTLGDDVWRVIDAELHTDDATGSKHLHLTLTQPPHNARAKSDCPLLDPRLEGSCPTPEVCVDRCEFVPPSAARSDRG